MNRLRPSLRLLLAIAVVLCLALAAVAWNTWRMLDERGEEQVDRAVRERSALLAAALERSLAARNGSEALAVLELLRDDRSLRFAALFDAQQNLLASLGDAPPAGGPAGEVRLRGDGELVRVERPVYVAGQVAGELRLGFERRRLYFAAELARQNAGIVLVGMLLAGFGFISFGLGLRRALEAIGRGLEALGRGEYEHRVPELPPGDVGELGNAVNRLAGALGERDASARAQQQSMRQETRRLARLLNGIRAVVWEADPRKGRFVYVAPEVEELLGHPVAVWLQGDFCSTFVHPEDRPWVGGFLTHPGHSVRSHTLDLRVRNRSGEYRWLRLIGSAEPTPDGPRLAGLLLDVTDEKRGEESLAYLAAHDSLTGLYNRHRFQELLQHHVDRAREASVGGALLFIDLDQFKYINDSYGHQTGDKYLRQVAQLLPGPLPQDAVLGRLGGDEFGVLLPVTTPPLAEALCRALLATLNEQEFVHEGRRTPFSASIGLAFFPQHGSHISELLANADTAMYEAKDQGRNTFCVFEGGLDQARMREKLHWEDRIRSALREERLSLAFQPIVDLRSGQVHHYESLLRMIGDGGEEIRPAAFIAIAERFGMIRELDRWVVETAIATQGASRRVGRPVNLTINLSARHFGGADLLELIRDATLRHGADPAAIVFEVTETAAVENFTTAREFIHALRAAGYRFALDDFGAGFSSLHYLKNLTVDFVKIDGSFIRNILTDATDRIFVKAIASLATGLGIEAIAEFVEDEAVIALLLELGIPLGQGNYFGPPAPAFALAQAALPMPGTASA